VLPEHELVFLAASSVAAQTSVQLLTLLLLLSQVHLMSVG
jgi:hypothetical protein